MFSIILGGGKIELWSPESGDCIQSVKGHEDAVSVIQVRIVHKNKFQRVRVSHFVLPVRSLIILQNRHRSLQNRHRSLQNAKKDKKGKKEKGNDDDELVHVVFVTPVTGMVKLTEHENE